MRFPCLSLRRRISTGGASSRRLERLLAFVNDEMLRRSDLARTNMDVVDGTLLFERLADDGIVAFY